MTLADIFFFVGSIFISVEDRTRRILFSYNYIMSFTYSQMVITKQAGNTLYTRSYNLKYQNMYDHRSIPMGLGQYGSLYRGVLWPSYCL